MSRTVRFLRWRVTNAGVFGERSVEIGPLGAGVNVISGPNECGKSTMVRALRAALFERFSLDGKKTTRPLQPHGTKLAPLVEVDFLVNDVEHRLTKQLLVRPFARLSIGGSARQLEDDAVDERLRELFYTHKGGKQGTSIDDMGLWGLLWVEQDDLARKEPADSIGSHVRSDLATAIERQVGQVIGGRVGVDLREAIERAYEEHFTAKQDRNKGELAQLEAEVAKLEAEAADCEKSLQETVRLGETIQGLDESLASLAERETELSRQLQEEEGELQEARAIEQTLEEARRGLAQATEQHALARGLGERRVARQGEVDRRQEAVRQHEGGLRELREREDESRRALDEARGKHDELTREYETTRKRADLAVANVERLQLVEEIARLERDLAEANRREGELRDTEEALRGTLSAEQLSAIEALDERCARHRAQAQQHATRITVQRPGGELLVEPITRHAEIDLGPLGRIEVEPPRVGFLQNRQAWREVSGTLREALARLQVESVREARTRAADDEHRLAEIAGYDEIVRRAAPKGIDALVDEHARADREHREAASALQRAHELRERVEQLDAEIAPLRMEPETVKALRASHARFEALRTMPDAAGIQMHLRAIGEARVQLGVRATPRVMTAGQDLSRRLVEPLTLVVDDRLVIEIDPGSLPAPAIERARREAEVGRLLESLGLQDVTELEARAAACARLEGEREGCVGEIAKLASGSFVALEDRVDRARRRAQELDQRLHEARKAMAERAMRSEEHKVAVTRAACDEVEALGRRERELEMETRRAAGRLVKVHGPLASEWADGVEFLDERGAFLEGARVTLTPGETVPDMELPVLEGRLRQELARVGAATVREARQLHLHHTTLSAKCLSLRGELARVAPAGAAALAMALDLERTRRDRLPEDTTEGRPLAFWATTRDALRRDEAELLPRVRVSKETKETREVEHRKLKDQVLASEMVQRELEVRARTICEALQEERAAQNDVTLTTLLAEGVRLREEASQRVVEIEASLARADMTRRTAALEQTRRQLKEVHMRREQEREASLRRQGELDEMRRQKRFARLDECRSKLDEARPKLARLREEAGAVRLLRRLAQECYASAEAELLEPVYKELGRLLPMLWESGRVRLDQDNWRVKSVDRGGVSEDFDSLSGGAREQLALIVRIALARVLSRERAALPMILDDILGWTDDRRLKLMLQVIERAARDMQVIVLTCHPGRFSRVVGAEQFVLDARRAAGP